MSFYCKLDFFKRFVCLFIREREEKERGGVEEERESQVFSLLSVEPNAGLDPATLRS